MEAGRELDALVAEKVMGWVWYHKHSFARLLPPNSQWAVGLDYIEGKGDALTVNLEHALHYSTNIAAAWEIVENLNKREWRVEIIRTVSNGVDVTITKWKDGCYGGEFAEWGETAPLAICRAALLAVGALEQNAHFH